MNFVNTTLAQLRELTQSMTPGARVTAGLLLAVVVVSLAFLVRQGTTGPDEYLFGGEPIPRSQIARMEAAMSKAGLGGFEVDGLRIKVPRGQKAQYIAAIADENELPADVQRIMDDALDGGSWFDSRDVKRQRIKAAREKQLSYIISQYRWVDEAHVIYDDREEPGLNAARRAAAAVSVMPAAGEELDARRARSLRDFVARACNLRPEDVTITNLSGEESFAGGGVSADDFDHPLYATRARIEAKMRGEILEHLARIPGVRVQVKAVIDDTKERRIVKVKPTVPGELLRKEKTTESSERSNGAGGGRTGLDAQGPARNGVDEQLARNEQQKTLRDDSTQDYVVGSETETTIFHGEALKEAEASIAVPQSYVMSVYRDKQRAAAQDAESPPDANELQQLRDEITRTIENLVQPLMPKLALGENEFKQVRVEFFYDLPIEPLPSPSLASEALAWTTRYSSTIAMLGVALVSLVMLRGFVSGAPGKTSAPGGLAALRIEGESDARPARRGGAAEDEGDDPSRPKLKLRRGESLKDDLNDMVQSDPEAAAAILKSWIRNSA